MKFTCVDCFSGAGGLALGLARANFKLLLSFDNDPLCIQTQLQNPRYFDYPIHLADVDQMLGGILMQLIGIT